MRLQSRLALLFAAVVTGSAALMGTLSYAAIAQRLADQVDESLLAVSTPIADELAAGRPSGIVLDGADGDGPGGHRGRPELVLPTQLVRPDGSVIAAEPGVVVLPVDALDQQMAGSAVALLRFRDVQIESRPYRMVTQTGGGASGAVQVGRDVSENAEVLGELAGLLALIGVVVAILAAFAGWLVARRSAARLVELSQAAEAVTETGRLDVEVPTAGSDEIARLGTAFDAMLLRLGQARADQQRLVQDAGHELRTPLTSLRTNVQLLRQFDAMPPEVRERVIADLDGETRELTHLVNEVVHLAGSSPAEGPGEPVRLGDLATSVVARAYRRTGRQVALTTDDSQVVGHATALERAIWNLVENACKFSAAGTTVELTVERGNVVVRDRGPGIDPGDLPHVFDRFYRATAARSLPGSGLGLAIVRDVVTAHGGRVFAANRPGGGVEIGFALHPSGGSH